MQQAQVKLFDIYFSAMSLLAMREHSAHELKSKLERKFEGSELVEAVVTSLIEQNLQSDERFAQAFLAMRQRQGKGPLIIKMELRQKGVDSELITGLIDDSDGIWHELACDVRIRKFRGPVPSDARERAKQMRFLQYRGFSNRHIQFAFKAAVAEDW